MEEMKSLLEKISGVTEQANVNAVFGEPREIEGRILIPVAEVIYGFGAGVGVASGALSDEEDVSEPAVSEAAEPETAEEDESATSAGVGGGGGARVRPLAYIEVGPDGTVIKPIQDEQKIAIAGILLSAWMVGWIGLALKAIFKK